MEVARFYGLSPKTDTASLPPYLSRQSGQRTRQVQGQEGPASLGRDAEGFTAALNPSQWCVDNSILTLTI